MDEIVIRLSRYINPRWVNEDALSFAANYLLVEAGYRKIYTADCSYVLKTLPPNTLVKGRTVYVGKFEDIQEYISACDIRKGEMLRYINPGFSSGSESLSYWVIYKGMYINLYGQKITDLNTDAIEYDILTMHSILKISPFIVVF